MAQKGRGFPPGWRAVTGTETAHVWEDTLVWTHLSICNFCTKARNVFEIKLILCPIKVWSVSPKIVFTGEKWRKCSSTPASRFCRKTRTSSKKNRDFLLKSVLLTESVYHKMAHVHPQSTCWTLLLEQIWEQHSLMRRIRSLIKRGSALVWLRLQK